MAAKQKLINTAKCAAYSAAKEGNLKATLLTGIPLDPTKIMNEIGFSRVTYNSNTETCEATWMPSGVIPTDLETKLLYMAEQKYRYETIKHDYELQREVGTICYLYYSSIGSLDHVRGSFSHTIKDELAYTADEVIEEIYKHIPSLKEKIITNRVISTEGVESATQLNIKL